MATQERIELDSLRTSVPGRESKVNNSYYCEEEDEWGRKEEKTKHVRQRGKLRSVVEDVYAEQTSKNRRH